MDESGKSLIKKLASCEQTVRDRAVRAVLETWLPNQTQVADEDMKKLWQGLFYCMWHADKLPYQSQLIDRLSSAVHSLDLPLSLHYFSTFLLTMRREWSRTDRLRLDKFYLLIRRFLHCFLLVLKNGSWDLDLTRRLMGLLVDGTLLADDKFQGNGVNYHVASIFVEELRPFLPLSKGVVELIFNPFLSVLGRVNDKVLVWKIKSNVFDELLRTGKKLLEAKKSGADMDSSDDAVVLGPIALSMGFSRKFYELGSSPDCYQGNRKSLFALHEEFLRLEKDMSSSGVEVSILELVNDDEEPPVLIPISKELEMNDTEVVPNRSSSKKGLKKCTKAKKGSDGSGKKSNKKSKKDAENAPTNKEGEDIDVPGFTGLNGRDTDGDGNEEVIFNESVISNLQMQFEKVASEMGTDNNDDIASACDQPGGTFNSKVSKKRKRANKGDGKQSQNDLGVALNEGTETDTTAKSGEKSRKRVRFSMKNNLVWKPHSPLPPQSLRLPPSATPRGSALKKGIPPGPIREMPSPTRKTKQKAKTVKKARKGVKSIKSLKKKKSP